MIECRTCKQEFPYTTEYFNKNGNKDPKYGELRTICRICTSNDQKVRRNLKKIHIQSPDQECEICGNKYGSWRWQGKFCLDHDHKTEEFRGWLCDKCNITVGKIETLKESGLLKEIFKYLKYE